jgi:peptidoglycan/xylan/chitin deacetylase (PgdA/CDA1 family)
MFLYDLARKAKGYYKLRQREKAGQFLSPVRRIERVAPLAGQRLAAMTFDDGPSAAPTNPKRSEKSLTEEILDALREFGAKGTFDVIGTTKENYPDKIGQDGAFSWGGERYDHYPDFGLDEFAGAKNQPALILRIINEGHELANHGYRHILFGRIRMVYGRRACFSDIHDVIADLKSLHELASAEYGQVIRLARPPHYVDKTPDGHSAYDAYRYMNYQYMAASFDGGGWKASSGSYEKDVDDMTAPLRHALEADSDSLNGQIIFQKDGCSMSRLTPVADALPRHLELLDKHGYSIVTVSELLARSPFEDIGDSDPVFEAARSLINKGCCIAYRNNTLQPDRELTFGELVVMTVPPEKLLETFRADADSKFAQPVPDALAKYDVSKSHPYFHAFAAAYELGFLSEADSRAANSSVTPEVFSGFLQKVTGKSIVAPSSNGATMKRRDALDALGDLSL